MMYSYYADQMTGACFAALSQESVMIVRLVMCEGPQCGLGIGLFSARCTRSTAYFSNSTAFCCMRALDP